MTIRRISSGQGLPAGLPFSLATEANDILYISGMPALDPAGVFLPGTFEEEADRAGLTSSPSPSPSAIPRVI